jgi:hypothetical protein
VITGKNFRRLTEQDIGEAFVSRDERVDPNIGRYRVLRSIDKGHGLAMANFFTFDVTNNEVHGKIAVASSLSATFCPADLPRDTIKRGVEACKRFMKELREKGRATAEAKREQRKAKRDQYGKPDSFSFAEEGDLETVPGKYVLWIDDEHKCYHLEADPIGKDSVTKTVPWGHEPRFGMDVEDSWKLFGNAKLGIKGLLREIEEEIRESGV